ncbi:hypothetical protein B0T26DRAFT_183776 [Lasiosphaeria miniovina]|uniref:Uncharacterized protein n=1 Tax=Lasiosphaeria miniovina TaxID=1954250 RepID=A0AA40B6X2_9PEZI|nr:uncharacterized protein B0T26DRAFT_183776 [Lasiosphaeria miniovina]KAK0728709.1 hypothetical protein B0T26DRAFT_183776 [Lasiosphaeria miniovina]
MPANRRAANEHFGTPGKISYLASQEGAAERCLWRPSCGGLLAALGIPRLEESEDYPIDQSLEPISTRTKTGQSLCEKLSAPSR